jgi:hypothetical protein
MQKVFNKVVQYEDYKINIKIELFTKIEKRPDGNSWHTLTVNDMGFGSYYKHYDVLSTHDLEAEVNLAIETFKESVKHVKDVPQVYQTLLDLGFK